jgi:TRAP-type C4-dicarboxylate transport system substrate-binding protein
MESPVMVESLNAMGANAVPMGWAEVITSLQQGLLDGQENPYLNILMSHTYEVTPIISETGHFYNPAVVLANLQWWKSLSDFERKVFKDAARQSARYERMYFSHYSDWARDYMVKEKGAKVVPASEIDIEAFRKACQSVYDKYLPKIPDGEAMLKQIRATK